MYRACCLIIFEFHENGSVRYASQLNCIDASTVPSDILEVKKKKKNSLAKPVCSTTSRSPPFALV